MFFLLIRRPPRTILTYTLFPYPTLFLSTISGSAGWARSSCPALFRNRRPGCSLSPASASWAPHCAFAAGRPQPPDRLVRDHLRGGGICRPSSVAQCLRFRNVSLIARRFRLEGLPGQCGLPWPSVNVERTETKMPRSEEHTAG